MTNTSKIILGVVGAAAVGVAIGMLLAPEKGSDIRKKISDTAGDLAGKVSDLITTGKEKLQEVASTVTKQSEGLVNDVSKRADRVKESVG
ncbi:YtxH domain-containing protein [Sediminibacterium roseum]|uniref:YtxH domain-containing protein n=1 Tax=Sediminibacterium roseum TaxID=1978412 RepID=A0ABW9ZZE0_9BACT|nr:YtxH domain-containing protein [Sediminibacterium roseum]NCI50543.1 YtxH domain-containing protein [Sediminibacterium roseum]